MEDMAAPKTPFHSTINQKDNSEKNPINYKDYFNYIQGDITEMKADVIVNSSSPNMKPITGVSKSIHNKCGSSLYKYLTKHYYAILPGSFVESPNYKLKCKVILHACGPDKEEDLLLGTLYEQCLNYCYNHNYHSIIFPCISTGGKKFNEDKACFTAINSCRLWIDKYSEYWKGNITFCCYTTNNYNLYKNYFKEILNL